MDRPYDERVCAGNQDRRITTGAGQTACLFFRQGERDAPRRQFRSGQHRGEGVEDVMLCLLDHVRWQCQVPGRCHVFTERRHDRADRLRVHFGGPQYGSAERKRTIADQIAAGDLIS